MTGVTRDSTTSLEFFGSSSAVSFMRQINSAIDARLERCQPSNPDPDKNCRQSGNANLVASQQEDSIDPLTLTLPPRNFADNLLQDYHDLVWVILPIHDWTVFQAAYNSIWLGSATHIPERPLYCMINMAFALGSQFSHAVQPMHRKKMGQTFWEKARTLFDPRLYEGASLEGVQCLLLMGLFLQSTCESHQCWMAVGAAVRMAQSLGLHLLSATGRQNEGVREVEISRRVWHGCVFMDRVLSITFGRPSMIADWLCDAVPLPLMIDDEYLDQDVEPAAIRPDGKTTAVAFFVKTLELYSIVNDSLRELYMRPADEACKDHQQLLSVLKLDNRLVQWAHSIPEQLCYISSKPQEDSAILRQSIVYLHARTVILRPVLAEFCLQQTKPRAPHWHPPVEESLSQNFVNQCSKVCFKAAHETINMIYAHLDLETVTGPVPAWWFAVLFVYTAAIVLLAERFRSNLNPSSESEPWLANIAWDRAIQLLKAYSKVGESAERCVAALEILSTKIQGQSGSAQHGKDTAQSSSIDNILNPDSITCQSDEGLLSGFDDLTASLNMEGMDFNIDDNLLWLNSSVADIMF
ncbi:C6 transcription factor [Ilyonectria destructans]|nr:C6 transcription factor [Ilyonectria destructans]